MTLYKITAPTPHTGYGLGDPVDRRFLFVQGECYVDLVVDDPRTVGALSYFLGAGYTVAEFASAVPAAWTARASALDLEHVIHLSPNRDADGSESVPPSSPLSTTQNT